MDERIVGLSISHDSTYNNFMGTLKENGVIDEIAFSLFRNPITVIFGLFFPFLNFVRMILSWLLEEPIRS